MPHRKLEQQAAADRLTASQKEGTFEMLMMDKAYLSKQVGRGIVDTSPN